MTEIPSIIEDLVRRGIPVTLHLEEGVIGYRLSGFYKSNSVILFRNHCQEESFYLKDRYNTHVISGLSDLVYHHAHWWESSKDRADAWSQPEELWIPLLLEHGYIEQIPPDTRVRYQPRTVR